MALKEHPYQLLVEHISTLQSCLSVLDQTVAAYLRSDFGAAETLAASISDLEDKADGIRKKVVTEIPYSFFLAISKHNILLLLRGLDKIVHHIEYSITLLIAHRTAVDTALGEKITAHMAEIIASVKELNDAMLLTYQVLKGEVGRKESQRIIPAVQNVIAHERKADECHADLIRMLYGQKEAQDPIGTLHLLRAVEHFDEISNLAERTAIRLASIFGEG